MNVSPHWNILFCGSNGQTTFVHLFSGFNLSGRHFVANTDLLRESNVVVILGEIGEEVVSETEKVLEKEN